MGKKNRNDDKKKNTMAPSTSNPTVSAASAPKEKEKEKAKAVPVSSFSERKSRQEDELMFLKKLNSADSNPALNRAAVAVLSDKMMKALSLTQQLKNIPYIRVLARDLYDRVYELRLSRNDDVHQGNPHEFILHHQWGKLVADNGLKEGHTVMGTGVDKFIDNQFKVSLRFYGEFPEPEPELFFLFEKKMDCAADLKQPAIELCSSRLKMALLLAPSGIRVSAIDPIENSYVMSLEEHGDRQGYTLRPGWEKFVAENGVEEGDLVTGTGLIFPYSIAMQLNVLKNDKQETTTSNKDWIGEETILFFEKTLDDGDTDKAFYPKLVIRSCNCKDVVRKALDQKLERRGHERAYLPVSATDGTERMYGLRLSRYVTEHERVFVLHWEWREVVNTNGLRVGDKVWCWGKFLPDDSICMKIDVDKEFDLWMCSMSA